MSRSVAEHDVAKFFHQRFGITLYPYRGDAADLIAPCGLRIEVKREGAVNRYQFRIHPKPEDLFDIAILTRQRRQKGKRFSEYAVATPGQIQKSLDAVGSKSSTESTSIWCPPGLNWRILNPI